jgi:hypothetical protein
VHRVDPLRTEVKLRWVHGVTLSAMDVGDGLAVGCGGLDHGCVAARDRRRSAGQARSGQRDGSMWAAMV